MCYRSRNRLDYGDLLLLESKRDLLLCPIMSISALGPMQFPTKLVRGRFLGCTAASF